MTVLLNFNKQSRPFEFCPGPIYINIYINVNEESAANTLKRSRKPEP